MIREKLFFRSHAEEDLLRPATRKGKVILKQKANALSVVALLLTESPCPVSISRLSISARKLLV
jgi:hypothetical protein